VSCEYGSVARGRAHPTSNIVSEKSHLRRHVNNECVHTLALLFKSPLSPPAFDILGSARQSGSGGVWVSDVGQHGWVVEGDSLHTATHTTQRNSPMSHQHTTRTIGTIQCKLTQLPQQLEELARKRAAPRTLQTSTTSACALVDEPSQPCPNSVESDRTEKNTSKKKHAIAPNYGMSANAARACPCCGLLASRCTRPLHALK
jgi:hypothetical protein